MNFRHLHLSVLAWVLFSCRPSIAQTRGYDWHMGPGMMGGWGWFGGILMVVISALIIIGVVYFIKWLVKGTRNETPSPINSSSALDILKKRYAQGEIDKQEFEEKKKDILA